MPDALRFVPDLPPAKQAALEKLVMGKVARLTLCFRDCFWRQIRVQPENKTLADLSFLFSRDENFPTWWTQMPEIVPMITGWAPARSAAGLADIGESGLVATAVQSLSSLLFLERSRIEDQLQAAYFHDWDADPFSRGAYSYVKAGGEGWQTWLASPVEDTLFFAGEATDHSGHNGTVHGAIASAKRAAQEIERLS